MTGVGCGGDGGMAGWGLLARYVYGSGCFRGTYGLVGYGDEGLGPRFRGDDGWGCGGDGGMAGWGLLARYVYGSGCFRGTYGLVGYGDEGLGPRFRGDDEEARGDDGGWDDGLVKGDCHTPSKCY